MGIANACSVLMYRGEGAMYMHVRRTGGNPRVRVEAQRSIGYKIRYGGEGFIVKYMEGSTYCEGK